ncbi:MAG: AEC family transporter [Opitutaceae bacterium]|jgi:predicted permease
MTIGTLFILILPVFALIAVGVALRRFHRIEGAAETSMIRLVVQVCMPCLVFDTIVGNASLRDPSNLLLPPIAGFATTVAGFGVARLAGQWIGLTRGTGLRSFALAAGICNYSYLPLPIVGGIWGEKAQGMVLVHNMGVDLALWSVGLLVLTGASPLEGWRRIVSPMLVTLVAAVAINVSGLGPLVPGLVRSLAHSLGVCAVPIGLVMTGVNLAGYLDEPSKLLHRNVAIGACVVRLAVLPALMLGFAYLLPCTVELKRVLVVEAAMPAAVIPIIIAQYYGGQPLTAVQVVLSTTAAGLVTCPLWIRAGLAWLGIS